jgi:hypothetical protein
MKDNITNGPLEDQAAKHNETAAQPAPEKVIVYRVAYNKDGYFQGFDYSLSRETAHWRAEKDENDSVKTRVDEIEIDLSPKGICDALNEYAIARDEDGFDSWYPKKDYPGRNVTWQIWRGRWAEKEKAKLLGSFGSFREAHAFVCGNDDLENGSDFAVVVENAI